MKNKTLYGELKAQFLKDNHADFILAVIGSLMMGSLCTGVSWGAGELIDTAAGVGRYSLRELLFAGLFIIAFIIVSAFITYKSQPKYIKKALCNYKQTVFGKLTEKNISSFNGESTATYLSALTNDAVSIEANYLEKQFQFANRIIAFFRNIFKK